MKYIGIGNEQWGPEYFERYLIFDAAIRAKYPDMQIMTSSGPFHEGEQFDYAYEQFKGMEVDLVDEHYYRSPEWFLENATRYDSYDRKGPKIFAGEYAAQSVATVSPDNKNNWLCAMSEAAFMTGLERNADIVHMTSYAPLFAHADAWQWTPDLIWFNNLESYGTANYYVQKMYSNNPGTHLLKVLSDGKPLTGQNKIYASAVKDEATGELIIKVVNASGQSVKTKFEVSGAGSLGSTANLEVLTNTDLEAYNTFDEPQKISPKKSEITVESGQLTVDLEPQSFTVIRVSI
jgi:alpha-N-arabinofuranosidase